MCTLMKPIYQKYIYVNIKCRHVCVSDVLGVLVYYVDTRLEVYCLRPFLVSQLENGEYAYTTADKSSSKASKDKLCLLQACRPTGLETDRLFCFLRVRVIL